MSWWRSQLMWRVFFTSAIVAVVVRTTMGWCKNGNCGHFGSGGFVIWDISDGQEDYSCSELLPMAVIGVIGGLLGALFNQLTLYITRWRRNHLHKRGNRVKIIEACLVSMITTAISFGLPLLRKCSQCPESDAESVICVLHDDAIRNLFSAKTIHEFSAQSLLTFLICFVGGSMRMTVSLCVIMVEITNNLKLLPLIMLVLLISKAVGDAF